MTLIERIRSLSDRSNNLVDLEKKLDETKQLNSLHSDAEILSKRLEKQVKLFRLFGDQGVRCEKPRHVENAQKTLSRLKERYEKNMRAEQLTQGQDWTRFKEQVEGVCLETSKITKSEWRRFVESAYTGQSPHEVKASLALTPGNKKNLPLYEKAFSELNDYARMPPTERAEFDRVRDIARRLTEIYQQFDFDVPESVKQFLRAVSEGGADLSLLTDEVKKWLEENDSSDRYRVVARSGLQ